MRSPEPRPVCPCGAGPPRDPEGLRALFASRFKGVFRIYPLVLVLLSGYKE